MREDHRWPDVTPLDRYFRDRLCCRVTTFFQILGCPRSRCDAILVAVCCMVAKILLHLVHVFSMAVTVNLIRRSIMAAVSSSLGDFKGQDASDCLVLNVGNMRARFINIFCGSVVVETVSKRVGTYSAK